MRLVVVCGLDVGLIIEEMFVQPVVVGGGGACWLDLFEPAEPAEPAVVVVVGGAIGRVVAWAGPIGLMVVPWHEACL